MLEYFDWKLKSFIIILLILLIQGGASEIQTANCIFSSELQSLLE